ncbi:MAG: hypothetical protein AAB539_04185 [Patescibacteria group bacterium]
MSHERLQSESVEEMQPSENRENILTSADRERLETLFAEIRHHDFRFCSGSRTPEMVSLRRRLQAEDGKAVTYILDRLRENETNESNPGDRGWELYKHIETLAICATPQDAQRLGELLLHDEVACDTDRTNKDHILEILQRVGMPENSGQLLQFAENTFTAEYPENAATRLRQYDGEYALETLLAIAAHHEPKRTRCSHRRNGTVKCDHARARSYAI